MLDLQEPISRVMVLFLSLVTTWVNTPREERNINDKILFCSFKQGPVTAVSKTPPQSCLAEEHG